MLRLVLVGILSVSASACESKDESVKSQPGVAAGKVIEVTGSVTVRHGEVARPLAKGETVEGDDVIETGADGQAVIELSHNLAKWELSSNKKMKVRESMAWKLAKNDGTAKAVEQDTAAAGRHVERNAADTTVSAESVAAPAPGAPQAAPRVELDEAPVRAEPRATRDESSPAPRPSAPKRKAAASDFEKAGLLGGETEGSKGLGMRGTGPGGGGGTGGGIGIGSVGTIGRGGGTGAGYGTGAGTTTRGTTRGAKKSAPPPPKTESTKADAMKSKSIEPITPEQTVRVTANRERIALEACLTKDMPMVTLTIVVGADGKATVTAKGKTEVAATVSSCISAVIAKLTFPAVATRTTFVVSR